MLRGQQIWSLGTDPLKGMAAKPCVLLHKRKNVQTTQTIKRIKSDNSRKKKKKTPPNFGKGADGASFPLTSNTVTVQSVPPWQARPFSPWRTLLPKPTYGRVGPHPVPALKAGIFFAVPLSGSDTPTPFLRNSPWRPTHQRPKADGGARARFGLGPTLAAEGACSKAAGI